MELILPAIVKLYTELRWQHVCHLAAAHLLNHRVHSNKLHALDVHLDILWWG